MPMIIRVQLRNFLGVKNHSMEIYQFAMITVTHHTVPKSRKTSAQKNMIPLMKNPQFLPNQADILSSEFIHWRDILTKFHNNWTKIVYFLVIAFYFPE